MRKFFTLLIAAISLIGACEQNPAWAQSTSNNPNTSKFKGQFLSNSSTGVTFANLYSAIPQLNGTEVHCKDCQQTAVCTGGGLGAWAIAEQGAWTCNAGAPSGSGGNSFPLTANVSAATHKITGLASNGGVGDALSQGQSKLNDLAAASAVYSMGGNKLQSLAVGTVSGDALVYGLSHLNDLAAATADYPMGTHKVTGLAVNTGSGDALSQGQSRINDLATATGPYNMGGSKITGLAAGVAGTDAANVSQIITGNTFPLAADSSAASHRITTLAANAAPGDALSQGQSHLNDLATATAVYSMGGNKLQSLAPGVAGTDAATVSQIPAGFPLTANASAGTNKITSLALNTVSGDALSQGQSHINDLATATGNYNMGTKLINNLAPGALATDAANVGQITTTVATTQLCPWAIPSGVGSTGVIYYVSSSIGDNSFSGLSPAAPWKTHSRVISQEASLQPGDKVLYKGGEIFPGQLGLANVIGSVAHPIYFGSYGTGQAIFDATGFNYGINACNAVNCNAGGGNGNGTNHDIIIDNIEVRHASFQAVTFQTSGGTPSDAVAGTPDSIFNITIQNVYIHNTGPGFKVTGVGNGTSLTYNNQLDFETFSQGTDNTHMYCNTVQDGGGWNALEVHYDTGAVDIEGNLVGGNGHACAPHGCIDTKGIGSTFTPAKRLFNIASCGNDEGNCAVQEPAMYTENTNSPHSNIIDQGNLIYDSLVGMQVCGGLQGAACAHAPCQINYKAYNNTVYSSTSSTYAINLNDDCAGVATVLVSDVRNNILDGKPEAETHSGSSSCTPAYNYNNQGGSQVAGAKTGCFLTGEANGQINIDPLYVSAAGKNFNLQSASTDLGTGLTGLTTNNNNIGAFGLQNAGTIPVGVAVGPSLTGNGAAGTPLQVAPTGVVAGTYAGSAITFNAQGQATIIGNGPLVYAINFAGLDPTGVADSTTAINTAFAACTNTNEFWSPGTYAFSAPLSIPSGCKILGAGEGSVVFKPLVSSSWVANSALIAVANGAQNVGLNDFTVDASAGFTITGGTQVNAAIFAFQNTRLTVQHVHIVDNSLYLAEGIGCDGCTEFRAADNTLDAIWGTAIISQTATAAANTTYIHHNTVNGTFFGNGLYCMSGTGNSIFQNNNCVIDDNVVNNFADTGIEIGSTSPATALAQGANVSNNRLVQTTAASGKSGILLRNTISSAVTGNSVYMCGFNSAAALLHFWASDANTVNNSATGNNLIQTCASGNAAGPVVWVHSASNTVKVSQLQLTGNNLIAGTAPGKPTLYVSPYGDYIAVTGGSIFGYNAGGTHAINFDCTSANCPGNTLNGVTTSLGFNSLLFTGTTGFNVTGNNFTNSFNAGISSASTAVNLQGSFLGTNTEVGEGAADSINPTLGTCVGGTMVAGLNDWNGEVTGTTGATCAIVFKIKKANTPHCWANDENAAPAVLGVTALALTGFTVNNITSGHNFSWGCAGN